MAEPNEDRLVRALQRAISAFLRVKRRYPLLTRTVSEIKRLERRSDIQRGWNDALNQLFRDSFDMLVIDLYSIRENMLSREGVFAFLKEQPERLWPRPSSSPDPRNSKRVEAGTKKLAKKVLGSAKPADRSAVEALCKTFMKRTGALKEDRNQVRAHRYKQDRDTSHLFIPLRDLRRQIKIIEVYLHDLYLLVTHGHFDMESDFAASPEDVAKDLADLIVHGSIARAVNYYGLVRVNADTPPLWYGTARRTTLRRSRGHDPVKAMYLPSTRKRPGLRG